MQRLEDKGSVAERARDGILLCLALRDEAVVQYVTQRANLSSHLVSRAAQQLRDAAAQAKQGDAQALNRSCARIKALFAACNAIVAANHAISEVKKANERKRKEGRRS